MRPVWWLAPVVLTGQESGMTVAALLAYAARMERVGDVEEAANARACARLLGARS